MPGSDSDDENENVLLSEVNLAISNQQNSIDLLYNKLNWVLVSNLVFLSAIVQLDKISILSVVLVFLSTCVLLTGFVPKKFNTTIKFTDQIKLHENKGYVLSLVKKKTEAYNSNLGKIKSVTLFLNSASLLLCLAFAMQILLIIKNAICNQ